MKRIQNISIVALIIFQISLNSLFSQNLSWANSLVGIKNSITESAEVKVAKDGTIYLMGIYTDSVNFSLIQGINKVGPNRNTVKTIFLAKYDKERNLKWVKSYDANFVYSSSRSYFDFTFNLTPNEDLIVAISYRDSFKFIDMNTKIVSNGDKDFVIFKLNNNGELIWKKSYGSKGFDEVYRQLNIEKNGDIIISGKFSDSLFLGQVGDNGEITYSTENREDIFITKLDSNGNTLWFNQFKCTELSKVRNVVSDLNGNIIIIGWFRDTMLLSDKTKLVQVKQNSKRIYSQFIIKLDSIGNILWKNQIDCQYEDNSLYGICTDSLNNIYTSGYFSGDIALNDGSGLFRIVNCNAYDLLLCKLDKDGKYKWFKQFENGRKNSHHTDLTSTNILYMIGEFSDSLVVNDTFNSWKLRSFNIRNGFLSIIDFNGKVKSIISFKDMNPYLTNNSSYISDIAVMDSSIYVTGNFSKQVDFNPTKSNNILDAKNSFYNAFIAKYSTTILNKDSIDIGNPEGTSSINYIDEKNNIYPNPFSNHINITRDIKETTLNVSLIDLQGRIVLEAKNIKSLNYTLNVGDEIKKGIYILSLKSNISTKYIRVIKE